MCAQVIFLHGASSSGKTTLARALQDRLTTPFWHVSIDHLRDSGVLPMHRFRNGDLDWQSARSRFFDGFHRSLTAYADADNDLIVEHILDHPDWAGVLARLLARHDVFFVGVFCDLETLRDRECQRGDRVKGSAEQDFHAIHAGRTYDMKLDGTKPVSENVEILIRTWQSGRRTSEFSAAREI
ncbi:MAG: AAA family ATPase [Rhodobacteraceae bacterium]|nr:AAA family ATPase [Paracoccaceae bacterium]